ncbi:MAG TPA: autotransporter-associated beta strand repeat-containing protein, partial [Candidatus Paceibacterota bacterium]|nr:autotransporter-associated beta strand repeat-containing protein [Candidatus Paceibacterota bacterium]
TYNLSGGNLDIHNWTVIGRNGGIATFNMTGGTINKSDGGNFIVGSASGNNSLAGTSGTMNHSGGTINVANQYWVAENALTTATNNISSTAVLNVSGNFIVGNGGTAELNQTAGSISVGGECWVGQAGSANGTYNMSGGTWTGNNWFSIGRNGGIGVVNLTNGIITKTGGGNFSIGGDGGATGTLNQYGGAFSNAVNAGSVTWIGQGGGHGFWNMYGGTASLGVLQFCEAGNGSGYLNLNGGVISASEVNCGLAGANGTFSFNGGTLRARADNATFFHGLVAAFIDAGGATIDSQNFNITVSQGLTDVGGGGLTKTGTGTLTLTGANSYTGPTVVSAGTLAINTAATATGDYSVSSGAMLAVTAQSMNAQLSIANLTLTGPSPALSFNVGAFGNPATAPLNVSGTLAVNGTVTVNLVDGFPQQGQIPVIQFATRSGSGNFVIGTVPVGVVANMVTNGNTIAVNISQVSVPRWDGQDGGTWDIGLTTNWINVGTGFPTTYAQGNAVTFDDNALGTTTVNLTTTVTPGSVTFNNSTLPYTLNGSGKISGSTGLTKSGTAPVTIANSGANDYTGTTVIADGTLSVASLANGGTSSAIGASSASPNNLVLGNGTLSYTGTATSINRGYSVQGTNAAIDVQANLALSGSVTALGNTAFTKTGPAQLAYVGGGSNVLSGGVYAVRAGSVVFNGSVAGQTNVVQGAFSVAGLTSAVATVTNATLTVNDNAVGNVAGSFGAMTVSSNTTLNVNSWLTLGDAANSVSTLTLNGGTVNVPNGRLFLCSAPGTMATLNINGGVINKNSGDIVCIADGGWNGSGVRTGVVNQVGGTFNIAPEIQIGQVAGGTGVYNLHGGALNSTGWFVIGRAGGDGTFNMDGGVLTHTSGGQPAFIVGSGAGNDSVTSVGVLNHSAGTINCSSEYWVAENTATVATNNISGTAVVNAGNWVS